MLLKPSTCVIFIISSVFSAELIKTEIPNISSTRVLSINQDSTGFLWFGTDEGLNRYDGHSNKVYRSNIFDEKTISGNRVWILHTDKNKTLWVGTDRGVCYYSAEQDRFHRINTGSRPLHVLENEKTLFFTTTNHGVVAINKEKKSVAKYQFDPLDPFSLSSSKFNERQTNPIATTEEHLWVGTTNGLNKINIKTGQTKRLYSGKTALVKGDTITSILAVNDVLFIGTTKGLGLSDLAFGEDLNENTGKVGNSYITRVFEIIEAGYVGVLLKDKIAIFKDGKIVQTIQTKHPLEKITNLKTGQYLITSEQHKNGLFLTFGDGEKETLIYEEIKTPIKANAVFVDTENGVWMVGVGGIVRAGNTKSPVSKHPSTKISQAQFSRLGNDIYSLDGTSVLLYNGIKPPKTLTNNIGDAAKPNTGIFSTKDRDLFIYNRVLYKYIKDTPPKPMASFNTQINKVVANKQSVFISLQNSGLAHHNRKTSTTTDYRKNRMLSKLLPAGASTFYLDKTILWIGNDESGLYELDVSEPESPRLIKHHTYNKSKPQSFSSNSVSCITKHAGKLFVGTNGDGLFVYDGKESFDKISINEGMPSNNIVSIAGSSDSTIWALTNGGLSLIDWSTKNINVVGQQEGLGSFFRNENALVPRKNGNALVVSPDELQLVNVGDLYTNEHEATVVVESVELIDKNNKKYITNKKDIKATHTTPTIRINLTAPSIFKAGKTTFSYFINGYNDTWVNNGVRRYIELQGLKPGTYTTQIKSYNSDGYESKNTATINFSVIPPWWETWWAYTSYAVAVFMFFAFYVKHQKRAQAKATENKRKEEELEEARQFQLDMLPRDTPDELGLDISSAIQTATEVGGDYYDYFPQKDGKSLYVVVGDATGHGMTAGMMVSITKAGLYGIPSIPPNDIARRLNRVIKNIDLGWNRMAFNMARFWEDRVEFTSAAMPPVYHYHGETGELDEVLLGGLPLGSIKDETFSLEEFDFNQGDSLVFISDGLPEAANHTGEMLGYDAVYNCIKANGNQSAEEQKQSLLDLGSAWLAGLQNQDDITIVVVKKSKPLE